MAPTTSLNVNVNVNLYAAVASDDHIIAVAAERVRTESTTCGLSPLYAHPMVRKQNFCPDLPLVQMVPIYCFTDKEKSDCIAKSTKVTDRVSIQ